MNDEEEKKDVMENILAGRDDLSSRHEELDCFIYRTDENGFPKEESLLENGKAPIEEEQKWEVTKDNVTIQVWPAKARIRFKIAAGEKKRSISLKQLANVAVEAIIKELQKEDK
ncbi:MAG: hypothetical protein K9J83_01240 [Desulfarculaceae bacterium]|nr:hypothetical protein [Desulfarculaceae bacterium]